MVSLLENWRVVLYHLDDLEVVEDSGGAVGSLTTGAGTRDPRLQLEENSGNRRPGGPTSPTFRRSIDTKNSTQLDSYQLDDVVMMAIVSLVLKIFLHGILKAHKNRIMYPCAL